MTRHAHPSRPQRPDRRGESPAPAGPATPRSRRGSAMILAISCVIFLLLIGLSFLSMTQLQRFSGSASARANNTDAAVDAVVQIAGKAIAQDFINYLTTNDPATQARAFITVATSNHDWLSSNAPGPLVGTTIDETNLKWNQVSWLGNGARQFTNIKTGAAYLPTGTILGISVVKGGANYNPATTTVTMPGGATAQGIFENGVLVAVNLLSNAVYVTAPTITINDTSASGSGASAIAFLDTELAGATASVPLVPINSENDFVLADASGSGFADSCWMELPIPAIDGQRWYAAFKIVDDAGMMNPNHHAEAETTVPGANVWGDTPADINMLRFLAQADISDTVGWGVPYTPATLDLPKKMGYAVGTTNSAGSTGVMRFLYQRLGYLPSGPNPTYPVPLDDVRRLSMWTTSRLVANPPLGYHPFDVSDLTEMRLHSGRNSKAWSPLEYAIDSGNAPEALSTPYGPLRALRPEVGYDTVNNIYHAINVAQYRADVRRHLTVHNPTRPIRPRWLTGITTNSIQYVSTTNSLDYQLPLNLATTNTTAYLDAIVSSLAAPGVNYEGSAARGKEAAHALYANLCARLDTSALSYSNPERNKIVQDLGGGDQAAYYPVRVQPFFKEISATVVQPDQADSVDEPANDALIDPTRAASPELPERFLAIELGNPFNIAADTTNLYINVNDELNPASDKQVVIESGATGIAPGGRLVIYTTNGTPTNASSRFAESVKLGSALTPAIESDPSKLAGVAGLTWTGDVALKVSLVYKNGADRVVIDRMNWLPNAASTNKGIVSPALPGGGLVDAAPAIATPFADTPAWPPPAIAGRADVSVGTNEFLYIITASIQRDDTRFHPATSSEAPRYVYEKTTNNFLEFLTTNVVEKNQRVPIMHRMGPGADGIKFVRVLNPGKGYAASPTFTIADSGAGATLTPTLVNTRLTAVVPSAAGTGYTNPVVTVDPVAGATQAKVVAAIGQKTATYTFADTAHFCLPEMVSTPFRNVGEIGNLLTFANVATTTGGGTTYKTISEQLGNPPVSADLDKPNLGHLHFDDYVRTEPGLQIPVAATIFDHFTTLDITPIGTAALPPPVPARININTAPPEVLAMLPYFRGLGRKLSTHQAPLLDEALVSYRDKTKLTTAIDYTSTLSPNPRATITQIANLRDEYGMASIGEPLMLRIKSATVGALSPGANATFTASVSAGSVSIVSDNSGNGYDATYKPLIYIDPPDNPITGSQATAVPTMTADGITGTSSFSGGSGYTTVPGVTVLSEADAYSIDRLGADKVDADAASGDPSATGDNVADDFKERLLHYARISNLITVHSDTFTAHIVLQGRRPDPANPTNYIKSTERRFIVGFDRSNVDGSPSQRMPRITFFAEEH